MTCPYAKEHGGKGAMLFLSDIGYFCNEQIRIGKTITRCGSTVGREVVTR